MKEKERYKDSHGFDHDCVRCDEMGDHDLETKSPGERGTCCVCFGHDCEKASKERGKHPERKESGELAEASGDSDKAMWEPIKRAKEASAKAAERFKKTETSDSYWLAVSTAITECGRIIERDAEAFDNLEALTASNQFYPLIQKVLDHAPVE